MCSKKDAFIRLPRGQITTTFRVNSGSEMISEFIKIVSNLRIETIILFAFSLIGASLYFFAAFRCWQMFLFMRYSKRATGTIIKLDQARDSGNKITFLPIVMFLASNNQIFEFSARVASSSPAYQIGDSVTVCYHPHRPREARIKSFWEIWGAIFGLVFLATFMVVFAIGFYYGA